MVIFIRYLFYVSGTRVVHHVGTPQRAGRHLRVIRLRTVIKELEVNAFRLVRLFRRHDLRLVVPFSNLHLLARLLCFLLLATTARLVLGNFGLLLRRVLALLLICVLAYARLSELFSFNGLRFAVRGLGRTMNAHPREISARRFCLFIFLR